MLEANDYTRAASSSAHGSFSLKHTDMMPNSEQPRSAEAGLAATTARFLAKDLAKDQEARDQARDQVIATVARSPISTVPRRTPELSQQPQRPQTTVDVTVAIPTYNGANRLPIVLDKLGSQTGLTHIRWEIIVCDNGSTDDTAAVVRRYQQNWPAEYPLHYRFAAEQGAAFARQYAVESAAGELIAFLDDDNLPAPNWVFEAYQFAHKHPQAGAIGSQIHGKFETELPDELKPIKCFLAIIERGDQPSLYEPAKKILPPAAGLVVRKQVWLSTVPTRLFLNNKGKEAGLASEDLEAILHIQQAGWDVWYNPNMVVLHDIPDSRLKKDYLVTLFRCVGLSRFHIRLLGTASWQYPFSIPAYIANDIRKLALHRIRYGRREQLSIPEICDRTLLASTVASPIFLFKKAYQDILQARDDRKHTDQKQWLAQITQAFEQDRFALYQQPVIAINQQAADRQLGDLHIGTQQAKDPHHIAAQSPDGSIEAPAQTQTCQNELLLRMHNSHNECILPSSFLPTARRYGLMRTIDRWVIRQMFKKIAQVANQPAFLQSIAHLNGSPLYAINLSADSVKDSSLAAFIAHKIDQVGLPARLFCFEISASTAMSAPKATQALMEALHQIGCQTTLDQVTLDQVTLSQVIHDMLNHLPLNFIKLHASVINAQQIGTQGGWSQIRKILEQNSVQAIAKGVESQTLLEALQAQGICYAQGYQMGAPRPL